MAAILVEFMILTFCQFKRSQAFSSLVHHEEKVNDPFTRSKSMNKPTSNPENDLSNNKLAMSC